MQKLINDCISKNQQNRVDTNKNEENDSSIDGEDANRFTFVRHIPVDTQALENRMSEVEKRGLGSSTTRNEHGRVIANWIEHKVLQKKTL